MLSKFSTIKTIAIDNTPATTDTIFEIIESFFSYQFGFQGFTKSSVTIADNELSPLDTVLKNISFW